MSIPGWMDEPELVWLYEQAGRMQNIVEIGCWMGRSTSALAAGCPGTVYTVDHFHGSPSELETSHAEAKDLNIHDLAIGHLEPYHNVKILRMSSLEGSRLFSGGSVDMVFIDGEHTPMAVLMDLVAWRPKCRILFCGHDSGMDGVYMSLAVYGVPFQLGPGSIWWMEALQ